MPCNCLSCLRVGNFLVVEIERPVSFLELKVRDSIELVLFLMRVANCLGSDAITGARGSRGVPVSLAATSAPSRVLFVMMVMEMVVAEPLSLLWMGEELLFWLGGVLFWLGGVLECLLFAWLLVL